MSKCVHLVTHFILANRRFFRVQGRLTSFANVTAIKTKSTTALFLITFVSLGYADDGEIVCSTKSPLQKFSVDYIHDGDTLWLSNGNKIRMIGLNAPEVGRRGTRAEPFAKAARDALRKKIASQEIHLEIGVETHDRYGRQLAHIFLSDKTNLVAWLLAQGFAMAITVPPNIKYRDCYQAAERSARNKQIGIWGDSYFAPISVNQLSRSGFTRIQGCVQRILRRQNSLTLKLSKSFNLRVLAKDMHTMQPLLDRLGDKLDRTCLIVRGWVYNERRTGKKAMNVRYPDAIESSTQH